MSPSAVTTNTIMRTTPQTLAAAVARGKRRGVVRAGRARVEKSMAMPGETEIPE